jgi:hypothetical protein
MNLSTDVDVNVRAAVDLLGLDAFDLAEAIRTIAADKLGTLGGRVRRRDLAADELDAFDTAAARIRQLLAVAAEADVLWRAEEEES